MGILSLSLLILVSLCYGPKIHKSPTYIQVDSSAPLRQMKKSVSENLIPNCEGSLGTHLPCRNSVFLSLNYLSNMLFRWEMNSISINLLKLLHNIVDSENLITSSDTLDLEELNIPDKVKQAHSKCNQCQESFLVCSVCLFPVKGLSLTCTECQHGGHLNHMKHWFNTETECPFGCGCQCLLKNTR